MRRPVAIPHVPPLAFLFLLFMGCTTAQENFTAAQEKFETWPRRVLITNDDGVEDLKLLVLARAFAKVSETWAVAPDADRSGTTHRMITFGKRRLTARPRDLGEGIQAYAVVGYPADSVFLALRGLMLENPPDLVVSGINGGANLGMDWVMSGTIGAARIATYLGVPAIAVSGVNEDFPGALEAASQWVVTLAQSELARRLKPGQYLTVSFPRIPPSQYKGVRTAERAGPGTFRFSRAMEDPAEVRETWLLEGPEPGAAPPPSSDAALCDAGYIVVVPMQADEHDYRLLSALREHPGQLPGWPPVPEPAEDHSP
jgi:5'-nucleotidase